MNSEIIDPIFKEWIDSADYYSLLRRWRFATPGEDPIFQGATGKYYSEVLGRKRNEHPDAAVQASKDIGWG